MTTADASDLAHVPASAVVQPAAQQQGSQVPSQQNGRQSSTLVMPVGSVGKAEDSHQPRAAQTEPAQ